MLFLSNIEVEYAEYNRSNFVKEKWMYRNSPSNKSWHNRHIVKQEWYPNQECKYDLLKKEK